MEIRIELKVGTTITRLAGNDYGEQIYKEQIAPVMDLEKKNIIVIPDYIRGVAISFVEGIMKSLPETVSRKEFYKYFAVEANSRVEARFRKIVMTGA